MIRRTLFCVLGCYLFFIGANPVVAVAADNPYVKIVDRNVFGLKPPAPPPSPESLRPPPPKITLTGITTIGGVKRVLMRVPLPARPPEPAKEESFMMTEGQRDGEIEVLEIDERTGTVRIKNYGSEMTLNLDKDGAKPQNSMAGLPNMVPTLNNGMPMPHTIPTTTLPPRTLRVPPQPPQIPPPNPNPPPTATVTPSTGMIQEPQPRPLDEDEQILMIETQRAKALDEGDHGMAKILPPTPLTSEIMGDANPLPQ